MINFRMAESLTDQFVTTRKQWNKFKKLLNAIRSRRSGRTAAVSSISSRLCKQCVCQPDSLSFRACTRPFGSGFVEVGAWWRLGGIVSVINILIWLIVGGLLVETARPLVAAFDYENWNCLLWLGIGRRFRARVHDAIDSLKI